jgi:hypothetical protein
VTGADLDDARAVRESVYRTAKAPIEGQSPAAADEKIINHAAAAPPPVPHMERGTFCYPHATSLGQCPTREQI